MGYLSALQHWPLEALAAIVAGVVVLLAPRALNYAVAAYLLLVGIIGVLPMLHGHGPSLRAALALVTGVLVLVRPNILNYIVGIYLILTGLLEAGLLRV
jgi:hypothetical protein